MRKQEGTTGTATGATPEAVLSTNLRALAFRSPAAAEAILRAAPHAGLKVQTAPDGCLTGTLTAGQGERRLASAYHPVREAQRLADSIDLVANAAVVIRGFGLGHHVKALALRMGQRGVVIVFEPDVELLRAVLERVNCSAWLLACPVVVVTGASDRAELTTALTGSEGIITLGTRIVDHPASRARLRGLSEEFGATLSHVVAAARTNVATTLVHVETTLRNLLSNVGYYTSGRGVDDLQGSRAGVPGVVVSAGPSLRRNVHLLREPGVRDRVVIIAVQTVLKQLLAMGVRPHFVCALDYHEISARFYEGLTPADVEGVTLVIEPKCNPAIPRAFPGEVRCVGDDTLDGVLGEGLARQMGRLPPGATVAHLCYGLARYLGCDPVVLIGQDLAFTDHHYYGTPGAAIHQVWSGELGEFRTLETLEWERIARMRGLLRRVSDQQGRPIHTDEQMATYQLLFERAFQQDVARGLTVIDATEGGALKQHTRVLPLALALERYASAAAPAPSRPATAVAAVERGKVAVRLDTLAASARAVQAACSATVKDLSAMLDDLDDQAKVNRLITRVHERAEKVKKESAYWLASYVNQTGTLNRFRADREIALQQGMSDAERQRAQVQRDIRNVTFMGEAAGQAAGLLAGGVSVLKGGAAQTRDLPPIETAASQRVKVVAIVTFDVGRSALGVPRTEAQARESLSRVLTRLAKCRELDGVIVAACDDAAVQVASGVVGGAVRGGPVITVAATDARVVRARRRAVAAARIWSRHSWRGGVAGLTIFDEALCPAEAVRIARGAGADAVAAIGDDWVMVDSGLLDRVVARHREAPQSHRLTYSQAPAGLCGAVIAASLLSELASSAGVHSTVGGLLGYTPDRPRMDPIAKAPCIPVPPMVRDCLQRFAGDDVNFMAAMRAVVAARGEDAWNLAGEELVGALRGVTAANERAPEVLEIDARVCGQDRIAHVAARVREAVRGQPALCVTIDDPTGTHEWRTLADAARVGGARAVHLRTTHGAALQSDGLMDALDFPLDLVSISLPADSQTLWEARTGANTRDEVWDLLQRLIDERNRRAVGGLPRTWLVPRIERCDATLEELESFFDRWTAACGACVIEAPRGVQWWERIEALPEPANVAERRAWSHGVLSVAEGRDEAVPLEGAT